MSVDPEEITFFAKTDARGKNVPFGIKAKDRTRHVYVIGKTGMGKSTLLENMAIQDIKNGNGLAFIDPHGQTAETLLDYIPESRKDDVLYFAPFDTANPVSFNVMEDVGIERRHLVVSGLMSVFKKIWVDAWSARMEYILTNTLMALMEYPDSTLLGVNRMLSDKVYRKKVIDNIKDPSVKSFWVDEFLKYNEKYMQEAGDAIKNKIGQFTANPLIRNIIGQPKSSFDIREIMDKKKILIMNLSKGLVGESNANLLGSMLTTRIYLAAMSRADMGQEEMRNAPNFYFYVDEFQSFANATFANILSEARKYKLNLTIAHQYIEQMEEEVRDAVFGNVGTLITFRVGPFDAEVLETVFTPKFLAPDIVNLGFAQIYLTLMIDGIGSHPFSATTLPPIAPPSITCKEMVIHRSRQQFSKLRDEVELAINTWHGIVEVVPQIKKEIEEPKMDTVAQESVRTVIAEIAPVLEAPIAIIPKVLSEEKKYESRSEIQKEVSTEFVREKREARTERTVPRKEYASTTARSTGKPEAQKITESADAPVQRKYPPRETKKDIRTDALPNKRQFNDAVQSSKNLEDLRAVLRGMTKTEEPKKVEKERDESPKKDTRRKEKSDENVGVIDSAVLAQGAVKNEPILFSPKSVRDSSLKDSKIEEASSVLEYKNDTDEAPVVRDHVSIQKSATDAAGDDPLSPKMLERMMRVTGNDSSPLK